MSRPCRTRGGLFTAGSPEAEIHPDATPEAHEHVVTKTRVSALSATTLDIYLRDRGIDTLILTGITTSGVVLSTLREAADLDYRLLVLEG
ncbi:MAG TPA: isochorismatase family cysteine hydrolase [Mycobacteriales bacterium]|nr:isochorismatase family cysteine hydrolase [Mycobacteriales bacterium]